MYYFTSDSTDCDGEGCDWDIDHEQILCDYFGVEELKEINYVPKGTYLVKSHRVFEVLNLIKDEDYTQYTNKREVVDKLKELVSLGENTDYQKQHIENIKDMVGKERIFK